MTEGTTWGLILGKHFLIWMKNLGHLFSMRGCPLEPQCLGQPVSPSKADPLVCLRMWFHVRFSVRKGFQFPEAFGVTNKMMAGPGKRPAVPVVGQFKASLSPSADCGVGWNDPKMLPNSEARYSGFTSRGSVGSVGTG